MAISPLSRGFATTTRACPLRGHTLRLANLAAVARDFENLPVGEGEDGVARAVVIRALCRLAQQRGVAARIAIGEDDGKAVCGQGRGARGIEIARDEDKGRIVRRGGIRCVGKLRQHLLREVGNVGGAGAQMRQGLRMCAGEKNHQRRQTLVYPDGKKMAMVSGIHDSIP